jgi:hypothetical protein
LSHRQQAVLNKQENNEILLNLSVDADGGPNHTHGAACGDLARFSPYRTDVFSECHPKQRNVFLNETSLSDEQSLIPAGVLHASP